MNLGKEEVWTAAVYGTFAVFNPTDDAEVTIRAGDEVVWSWHATHSGHRDLKCADHTGGAKVWRGACMHARCARARARARSCGCDVLS